MNKKKKKLRVIFILTILIVVSTISLFIIKNNNNTIIDNPVIEEPQTIEEEIQIDYSDYIEEYKNNKSINDDYVGRIVFDSGLIDLPFVQADDLYDSNGNYYRFYLEDGSVVEQSQIDCACNGQCTGNDVYIRKDWQTGKYDIGGSNFVDYRNTLYDQNYIIFGHHFARDYDPSGSKQFTPLDLLLDETNYKDNNTLCIYLENEVRKYEVVSVIVTDITDINNLILFVTDFNYDIEGNYNENYFDKLTKYINDNQKYSTNVEFNENDTYLTLITCIEHRPSLRELVFCKEISRDKY